MGVDNGSSIVVGASRSVLSPHELLARALRGPEHAPRSAAKELPLALRRGRGLAPLRPKHFENRANTAYRVLNST